MNENKLRIFHRRIGVFLALFIFIQIATGTAISIYHLYEDSHREKTTQSETNIAIQEKGDEATHEESEFEELLEFVHKKGGSAGDLYRVFLGFGIIFMAISGTIINREIKRRTKERGKDA